MLILVPLFMGLVYGHQRLGGFVKNTNLISSTGNARSIIRCAISCLSEEKCISFIHNGRAVCETSTKACGDLNDGSNCYNKLTSKLDSEGEKVQKAFLLFLPNHLPQHNVRKINMHTNEITEYNGLSYENVMAATYMHLSRKLILCIGLPYEITAIGLSDKKKTILRKAEAVVLATDEKSKIIFYSLDLHGEGVGKVFMMTTEGEHVKKIGSMRKKAYNLVTDVKNHKLYIAYDDSIVVVDYTTLAEEIIVTDSEIKAIALDPEGGMLYYNRMYFLHSISLIDKTKRNIINMWNEAESLEFYENSIFVASSGRINLIRVKKVNTTNPSLKFLDVKEAGKHPVMCRVSL